MLDDFNRSLDQRWRQTCIGGATLQISDSVLHMAFESAEQGHYTDTQIDDCTSRARSDFPWRPPLRMEVRARSSLPAATLNSTNESSGRLAILRGTAGPCPRDCPLFL